jgi:hypothetical protein
MYVISVQVYFTDVAAGKGASIGPLEGQHTDDDSPVKQQPMVSKEPYLNNDNANYIEV